MRPADSLSVPAPAPEEPSSAQSPSSRFRFFLCGYISRAHSFFQKLIVTASIRPGRCKRLASYSMFVFVLFVLLFLLLFFNIDKKLDKKCSFFVWCACVCVRVYTKANMYIPRMCTSLGRNFTPYKYVHLYLVLNIIFVCITALGTPNHRGWQRRGLKTIILL